MLHKIADQRLQQVVAVNAADDGAGVLVGRDVGRVLRQDVADELIDGVDLKAEIPPRYVFQSMIENDSDLC